MANEPEKQPTGPERTIDTPPESGSPEQHPRTPAAPLTHNRPITTKGRREASFANTMKEVQAKMKPGSRTFSKIIHTKLIEESSEVLGATLARPNAILLGALFAFVFTLVVYLTAKHYGYPLSGFESIGAFVVGWIIGVLFDYLKVLITGKK